MNVAVKIILGLLAVFVVFWFGLNIMIEAPNNNPFGSKKLIVDEGMGVGDIAERLKNEGFTKKDFIFKTYVLLRGLRAEFHPGEYQLETNMNLKEIITILTDERTVRDEVSITIIEGWKNVEIAEYLESKVLFSAEDFLHVANETPNFDYNFLGFKPRTVGLEGFLYPDTYVVYTDSTPEDVIIKMLDNFERKLDAEVMKEIGRQKRDLYEVLTLASIVEKEMFGYENRQIVAGIFWERLGDNYPLQSDATVNYITRKGTTRPSLDDTKIENPYNTYQVIGLPPTPICNPSIEAIRAVVYPKETDYYFFLTTPNNKIIFSRNHEEHIANRIKYLD
ncbi:TPA: endolytic transglycosylase MltG [Candidatus Falkowbacteria bacterium]|nr:endolytic transglycosylase MltG [Candidatus Falkowbacteria bacterium]